MYILIDVIILNKYFIFFNRNSLLCIIEDLIPFWINIIGII